MIDLHELRKKLISKDLLYLCISWYILLKTGSLSAGTMEEVLLDDGSQPYKGRVILSMQLS